MEWVSAALTPEEIRKIEYVDKRIYQVDAISNFSAAGKEEVKGLSDAVAYGRKVLHEIQADNCARIRKSFHDF